MGTFEEDNKEVLYNLVPGSWADRNKERAILIARHRHESCRYWRHLLPLSNGYQLIGVFGELRFEQISGVPIHEPFKNRPDGGIDFMTDPPIDVKSALHYPPFLAVPPEKIFDVVYALAWFNLADVFMLGWEYGRIVKQAGTGYLKGPNGKRLNHLVPRGSLRGMGELYSQVCVVGGEWWETNKVTAPEPEKPKEKPRQLSLF